MAKRKKNKKTAVPSKKVLWFLEEAGAGRHTSQLQAEGRYS
jgi:hypothetical protein